jgi:hypothetical protein
MSIIGSMRKKKPPQQDGLTLSEKMNDFILT